MKQHAETSKYILQNELRTWSDLKKQRAAANGTPVRQATTAEAPMRRWGGCASGCNHKEMSFPSKFKRQNTADFNLPSAPGASVPSNTSVQPKNEQHDHPIAAQDADAAAKSSGKNLLSASGTTARNGLPTPTGTFSEDADNDNTSSSDEAEGQRARTTPLKHKQMANLHLPLHLGRGRDGGGSDSGATTPGEGFSDDSDYGFIRRSTSTKSRHRTKSRPRMRSRSRTIAEWQSLERESGMGRGVKADRLGDEGSRTRDGSLERVALSGVEEGSGSDRLSPGILDGIVDGVKKVDRKGFGEIY